MSSIIAFLSPINLTRHVAIARPPTCGATPSLVQKGPQTPTPSYTSIDARPQNKLFTAMFLSKLQLELGQKASSAGYAGVIEVVLALAGRHRANPTELRLASQRVLRSLFPTWLPPAFAALFSRPFPRFAAWINAVVTVAVTQWLMGASQLADDGTTVEIERCRYLEGRSPHFV